MTILYPAWRLVLGRPVFYGDEKHQSPTKSIGMVFSTARAGLQAMTTTAATQIIRATSYALVGLHGLDYHSGQNVERCQWASGVNTFSSAFGSTMP